MKKYFIILVLVFLPALVFAANTKKDISENIGCCFMSDEKGMLCVSGVRSLESCKSLVVQEKKTFVKYKADSDCLGEGCYNQKSIADLTNEVSEEFLRGLRGIHYPARILINDSHWFTRMYVLNWKNILLFVLILSSFLVPCFYFISKRKKYQFLSYPLILLLSLPLFCLIINVFDAESGYQFYIFLGGERPYLISNLVSSLSFFYFGGYLLVASLYHFTKFKNGELTPLMSEFVMFIDRTKAKFNL